MVFGMVGHVPHQQADRHRGIGGAGVRQHVVAERRPGMLRQQVEPQPRLTEQRRPQPQPERLRAPQDDAQQRHTQVDGEMPARLGDHRRTLGFGHEVGHSAAAGVAQKLAGAVAPVFQAADVEQVLARALGFRRRQLRIAQRILREAVVRGVKAPEVAGRKPVHEADQNGDEVVGGAAPKGSTVHAFVQGREQRYLDQPLQGHRRQHPEAAGGRPGQRQARQPHRQMGGEPDRPGSVTARRKAMHDLCRQQPGAPVAELHAPI